MGFKSSIFRESMDPFVSGFFGGLFGTVVAIGIMVALIFFIALYCYFALAWQTIARRQKHKSPWLAWIPFANMSMILQMGGFHWAWIFLMLIPIAGWLAILVLLVIATWRIFEKANYPGWFSLSMIIPKIGWVLYFVAIGFVAWKPKMRR
ncbi:MAG: hypothetical protein AABW79_00590 [Nanoarchaeota archaeon]